MDYMYNCSPRILASTRTRARGLRVLVHGRCAFTISGFLGFPSKNRLRAKGPRINQSRAGNTDLAPYSSGYRRSRQTHNGVQQCYQATSPTHDQRATVGWPPGHNNLQHTSSPTTEPPPGPRSPTGLPGGCWSIGYVVDVGVHGGWGSGRLKWESGGWRWLAAVLSGRPADLSMVLTWMPSLGWGGRRKCS